MPELPEIECLARSVRMSALGGSITQAKFFRSDLRWKIPVDTIEDVVVGRKILEVTRRSKYLLLRTDAGFAVMHLGMSGQLLEQSSPELSLPHTHAVMELHDSRGEQRWLHFVDPRRFGQITAVRGSDLSKDKLFRKLGPEPLDPEFDLATHLHDLSRERTVAIKNFIMDAHVVVGVGNIYASEALFRAGLRPQRKAGTIRRVDAVNLAAAIRETLSEAVAAGGTTFRDYRHTDGSSGWFKVQLAVYGRRGEPCPKCGEKVREIRLGGRSSAFCAICQK